MNIKDGIIHLTEVVDGVRVTHDRLATEEEIAQHEIELANQEENIKQDRMLEIVDELSALEYKIQKQTESRELVELGEMESTYYTEEEHKNLLISRRDLRTEYNELENE